MVEQLWNHLPSNVVGQHFLRISSFRAQPNLYSSNNEKCWNMADQLRAVTTVFPGRDQKNELVDTNWPTEISLQGCWSVYVLQAIDKEAPHGAPDWRYRGDNQSGGNAGLNGWTTFPSWPGNCRPIPYKNLQVSSKKSSAGLLVLSVMQR